MAKTRIFKEALAYLAGLVEGKVSSGVRPEEGLTRLGVKPYESFATDDADERALRCDPSSFQSLRISRRIHDHVQVCVKVFARDRPPFYHGHQAFKSKRTPGAIHKVLDSEPATTGLGFRVQVHKVLGSEPATTRVHAQTVLKNGGTFMEA